ncbi:hypothetical protein CCS01_12295 [Rhodopila globiformis]|uniref:Uncharacterized protein n=1 Tax=Rhodopila globiformis TaxID=1071 RepID=A0A2S6NHT3_RHOGL|nr:hypothetical protein CCS01_12295 [Rhodopila globiformis]
MTTRTAPSPVGWQRRQPVQDRALVACDLAQEDERVALLSDESGDEVFEGWPLSLGFIHQEADQGT